MLAVFRRAVFFRAGNTPLQGLHQVDDRRFFVFLRHRNGRPLLLLFDRLLHLVAVVIFVRAEIEFAVVLLLDQLLGEFQFAGRHRLSGKLLFDFCRLADLGVVVEHGHR